MRRLLVHPPWLPLLVCGVALAVLTGFSCLSRFTGELYVEKGSAERVVVRPAGGPPAPGVLRGQSVESIPFLHPWAAAQLLASSRYDALSLPFSIRLDDTTVLAMGPPRESLEVERGSTRQEYPAVSGTIVETGGAHLRIGEVRPWGGLIRHPSGTPMAAVSLRAPDGGWGERLLLRPDVPLAAADLVLSFEWVADAAAAELALTARLDVWKRARWGVEDAGRIHWFQSFQPGSGVTLADNTGVKLVRAFLSEHGTPCIEVAFRNNDGNTALTVQAGARGGPVSLECPLAAPQVLLLEGGDDTRLRAAWYLRHERVADTILLPGALWQPPDLPFPGIRLDQVMAQAIPVTADQLAVWALTLHDGEETVALREGQTETLAGARLTYRRLPQPGAMRYVLQLLDKQGAVLDAFDLAPGAEHRYGRWVLRQAPSGAGGPASAVLEVERKSPAWIWWSAGALVAAALLFYSLPRFRRSGV